MGDRERLEALRQQCGARLAGHGYGDCLARVLALTLVPGEATHHAPIRTLRHTVIGAAMENTTAVTTIVARRVPLPFTATPRRNLLYHVWPVRGGTWRWNLDELKRRIDLFNGKRVIGIVCDERSEPAEAVQAYLDGHGCDYVVAPNDARGEAATFRSMLERVASTGDDEVSFYAHAKGVKYEPQFPPSVRRWAEVQYGVTLDDWLGVKEQLGRYAMTGVFRKHGRFSNHGNVGDWHYSGTFFWMRHAPVFTRRWDDVPQFYGGVEAWPGMHFQRDETGWLLLDNVREVPYQQRFWTQRGNPAFRQWQAAVRRVPTPSDLATPAPFDGHTWPRLEQKPREFARFIELLIEHRAASLLSIGDRHGGVEWHVARAYHALGRAIEITAVAPRESAELTAAIEDARRRFGVRIRLFIGRADALVRSPDFARPCDAAFIDGDHGYQACRADFEVARSLEPRLISLHDIVDSDWHAANRCCVSRLWAEIVTRHATEEIASGEWGGIGLVTSPAR